MTQSIPEGSLVLVEKKEVARDTLLLRFQALELPVFKAGQFLSLKFGETAWRAYSIASKPGNKTLDLLVRLVEGGLASEVFAASKVGDEFIYRGPYGHFVLPENAPRPVIFCATGTGIAPIWSMIQQELDQDNPRPMEVWYGGRDENDIAYLDDLKHSGVELKIAFSKNLSDRFPEAFSGRMTQFADLGFPKDACFYICGNGDMVKSMQEVLLEKGVDKKNIIKERFN